MTEDPSAPRRSAQRRKYAKPQLITLAFDRADGKNFAPIETLTEVPAGAS